VRSLLGCGRVGGQLAGTRYALGADAANVRDDAIVALHDGLVWPNDDPTDAAHERSVFLAHARLALQRLCHSTACAGSRRADNAADSRDEVVEVERLRHVCLEARGEDRPPIIAADTRGYRDGR